LFFRQQFTDYIFLVISQLTDSALHDSCLRCDFCEDHCMLFKFSLFFRLQLTDYILLASSQWTDSPLYYSSFCSDFCEILY